MRATTDTAKTHTRIGGARRTIAMAAGARARATLAWTGTARTPGRTSRRSRRTPTTRILSWQRSTWRTRTRGSGSST
eukprot:6480611-Lingulodinium_polyedra.AAC.1